MASNVPAPKPAGESPLSPLTEADILRQLVEVGEGLAKACDQIDQPLAASYFLTTLDILRASADLSGELKRGDQG